MLKLDLTGQSFGKLTVLSEVQERKRGAVMWKCVCACGTLKLIRGLSLKAGDVQSCGCVKRESTWSRRNPTKFTGEYGIAKTKSGNFQVRIYGVIVGTFKTLELALDARREFEVSHTKPERVRVAVVKQENNLLWGIW